MSKVTTPSTVDGHLGTVTDNRPSEALAAEGVPMRARWACAVLAAILALGACGGDSSEDSTAAAEGPDASGTDGEALATAVSIDANVDVSLAAAEFTSVDDPVPVEAGDVVRTDSSGFAEVTYFDGSLTRLDVDTSFTVIELTDTPDASVVRTDMGIGRTWNRVEELSGDDQFIVETAVATATVRGTAFLIDCPDDTTCTFTVIEGTIELTLPDGSTVEVEAPSSATVTDGEASDPIPAPWDTTFGQDWILDNGQRDTEAGFASPEDIYETHGPENAAGAGGSSDAELPDPCALLTKEELNGELTGSNPEYRPERLESTTGEQRYAGGGQACYWDTWSSSPGVIVSVSAAENYDARVAHAEELGAAPEPIDGLGDDATMFIDSNQIIFASGDFVVGIYIEGFTDAASTRAALLTLGEIALAKL